MNKTKALLAIALGLTVAAGPTCKKNHPPDAPAVPTGPQYCLKDTTYTFKTTAVDPDGDSLAVRFNWGDSSTSSWSDWHASGDTIAQTYRWSDTGTYQVRAWAMDKGQLVSELSGALTVRVGWRRPPNAPARPTGPRHGGQDSSYVFATVATHPDSLTVAVKFAWGDGDTSAWSAFVPSGESLRMSHTWTTPGVYVITAQAKDTGSALSLWSPPCSIDVRPPDTLRKWRLKTSSGDGTYPTSSPAIGTDGTIYVGSLDSTLYAVNTDGSVKWRYRTGGQVRSSPAIGPDGMIYVGSFDSCVHAVHPEGPRRWKFTASGRVTTAPAIAADGTIYFGTWQGSIYAVNPDGTPKWNRSTGSRVYGSPVIAVDGTVYVGSGGQLLALNPDSTLKWVDTASGQFWSAPAIDTDGAIYVGSEQDAQYTFRALNRDGTLKWGKMVGQSVRSAPAIGADGTIYAGSGSDSMLAFNPDGGLKWSYRTGGYIYSGPAIAADGTIYFGSSDSCLYALDANGTLKWRYETDGIVQSSPTIGSDGTVYFTSDDGYLYALKGTSPLATSPWPKFHHDLKNTGSINVTGWRHLQMVGSAQPTPDSTGFTMSIANDGTAEDTVSWLEMVTITPDSAYLRDFQIGGNEGTGFPLDSATPGKGAGDTLYFAPVTVAPNMSQQIELVFLDFHVSPADTSAKANIVGKQFQFRFSDGSTMTTPVLFRSRVRAGGR